MKRFLLFMLLAVPVALEAQFANGGTSYLPTNHSIPIRNKAFTSSTSDTTQALDVSWFSHYSLNVQPHDTANFLIYYSASADTTFPPFTLVDSAKVTTAATKANHGTKLDSVVTWAKWIKFVFKIGAGATSVGTGVPRTGDTTYTVTGKKIQ